MSSERVVAIGFLTASDLERLGQNFKRAFPIPDARGFEALLEAIDQADIASCLSRKDGGSGANGGASGPQSDGRADPRPIDEPLVAHRTSGRGIGVAGQ